MQNLRETFNVRERLLFHRSRLCMPPAETRNKLLHYYHSTAFSGHLGETKIWSVQSLSVIGEICKQLLYNSSRVIKPAKKRRHEIANLVVCCNKLKLRNPSGSNYHRLRSPIPKNTNENSAILNIVCKLSNMIRIIPIKSKITAPKVASKFKKHIYRRYGLPLKIISDRESLFISKFWKALFKSLNTKLALSTAYLPQTDGQSEIANPKIGEMISTFVYYKKEYWDENLVDFEVAYNSAIKSASFCSAFYVN